MKCIIKKVDGYWAVFVVKKFLWFKWLSDIGVREVEQRQAIKRVHKEQYNWITIEEHNGYRQKRGHRRVINNSRRF